MYFALKVFISALVIAAVSELARRYTLAAAILLSLPLTSILAFIWLYIDTQDNTKLAELSYGTFWAVLPSLVFFLVLPVFLKWEWNFVPAMLASVTIMLACYGVCIFSYRHFIQS